MWSAMPLRIAFIGSIDSPGPSSASAAGCGAGAGCGGGGAGGAGGGAGGSGRGAARREQAPRAGVGGVGLDEGQDVLLRDAAAAAGALDLRRVDAVLGRDARDDRRDEAVLVAGAAVAGMRRGRAARSAARAARSVSGASRTPPSADADRRVGGRLGLGRLGLGLRRRLGLRRGRRGGRRRRSARAPCRPRPSRPPARGSR